jgi:hypothetical protein
MAADETSRRRNVCAGDYVNEFPVAASTDDGRRGQRRAGQAAVAFADTDNI